MKTTNLFLDLDGVLVDLVGPICKLHGLENPYLKHHHHGKYDLVSLTHLTAEQFWAPLGYDFWANLPWHPNGKSILTECCKYIDEDRIILLTSPIRTPGCIEGKMDWIRKNMPRWSRRFLIGPAKDTIANPDKLLIDDYDKNIVSWHGPTILVPGHQNTLHKLTDSSFDYVRQRLWEHFNAERKSTESSGS